MAWELSYSIPRPPCGAWGRVASGEIHPHVTSPFPFSPPFVPELAGPGKTEKQDFSPWRARVEERGGEHSMHTGPCLQTLQENTGCLGQEGFLEIFSSSESISTNKLKASDGWQVSSCGRPPAGTGEGVGAKETVFR